MRIPKSIKTTLKIILVIAFYYGLYLLSKDHFSQLTDIDTESIAVSWLPLILAILLAVPNWLLEAAKWRLSLRPVEDVSFGRSLVGVLKGIPPSLFTPNRVGEAVGRPSVLQKGHRIMGALATAYCGFSQMPVMLLMGSVSCIYFAMMDVELCHSTFLTQWWFILICVAGGLLLGLFFVFPQYTIPFVRNSDKSEGLRNRLRFFCQYTYREKFGLFGVSWARFMVYSIQNYLTIVALGIDIGFVDGLMSVFLIYTLMSFVPRPALAELGVRCSASVLVLKDFCADYSKPTISSIILWCINLLLPAICGAMLYIVDKKDKKNG